MRLTRGSHGFNRAQSEGLTKVLVGLIGPLGVLDDAAASGRTMRFVISSALAAGTSVELVAVGASARMAREAVHQLVGRSRWKEFMPGDDWKIAHLRDGCAFLPYTGWQTQAEPVVCSSGAAVELRHPASIAAGSLWQVLSLNSAINGAMMDHKRHIASALASLVGRKATIGDLPTLGPASSAPIAAGQSVVATTNLEVL